MKYCLLIWDLHIGIDNGLCIILYLCLCMYVYIYVYVQIYVRTYTLM